MVIYSDSSPRSWLGFTAEGGIEKLGQLPIPKSRQLGAGFSYAWLLGKVSLKSEGGNQLARWPGGGLTAANRVPCGTLRLEGPASPRA